MIFLFNDWLTDDVFWKIKELVTKKLGKGLSIVCDTYPDLNEYEIRVIDKFDVLYICVKVSDKDIACNPDIAAYIEKLLNNAIEEWV